MAAYHDQRTTTNLNVIRQFLGKIMTISQPFTDWFPASYIRAFGSSGHRDATNQRQNLKVPRQVTKERTPSIEDVEEMITFVRGQQCHSININLADNVR